MTQREMTQRDSVDPHVEQSVEEFPSIDPEVEGIVARICKVNRYLDVSLDDTLEGFDLNRGDFRILVHLRSAGPPYEAAPKVLGDYFLISTGSMTNRLDRLETRGLIERSPDPKDRRSVVIRLTDKGISLLDDAVALQAKKESDVMGPLTDEERKVLVSALRSLVVSMEDRFGPAPRRPVGDPS
jgi:DNA-binding MarR family transcriptional regulator